MIIVLALGISKPLSMIVVLTSTSASPLTKRVMTFSSSSSAICPCPTRIRASGTSAFILSAMASMVETRLCKKYT